MLYKKQALEDLIKIELDKIIDRNERLKMLKEMYQSRDFGKGRIYMMGHGAVGPPLLYMILKILIHTMGKKKQLFCQNLIV